MRIERKADQIDLEVRTARPGVVVGRGGQGIESLRLGLQGALGGNRQIRINVVEVQLVDADAYLIAEYIAQQLERRVSFRRVVRQAIQRAQRAGVQGIKVQVGGRLNGQKLPAQSGLVKVEFLSTPYALILTILAAQLRQFTEFSELKFGSLKAKLFLDRNKLPLNQLKTVNVEIVTVNANPVADNNNVAVNSLKTAPMKPSQCS